MNNKIKITRLLSGVLIASGLLLGCSKEDTPSLSAAIPSASFKIAELTPSEENPSNVQLINTSTGSMTAYWKVIDDEGNTAGEYTGDTVAVALIFAGNYTVKMAAAGPGGLSDTITGQVELNTNNTYAVGATTLLGILTGAANGQTQRTWSPARELNSVIVWDNYANCLMQINGGAGAWWGFGPGEIATDGTGRDGYFDDAFTFTFEKVGKLIYDDKNTVFLDNGGSGWTGALPAPWNTHQGTIASADLFSAKPDLKPWGSGNFGYSIAAAPAGEMNLGTITVTGLGAHLGLPDKINGGESVIPTATTIHYDVLQIDTDLVDESGTHYDRIVIGVHYDAAGDVFTFMLRSDR